MESGHCLTSGAESRQEGANTRSRDQVVVSSPSLRCGLCILPQPPSFADSWSLSGSVVFTRSSLTFGLGRQFISLAVSFITVTWTCPLSCISASQSDTVLWA